MISANNRLDYSRDFSLNCDSFMISDESSCKNKFSSVRYYYITWNKIKRGATDTFITKFPPKGLKKCSLQSAGNSSLFAFTHEWSFSSRERFVFKNTLFCENIRACLVSPCVLWRDRRSTKLDLVFSQIEQKPARLRRGNHTTLSAIWNWFAPVSF